MVDDILLNKSEIIERCIKRIKEEFNDDERNLYENFTKQDSIILNLQRVCEASIDLSMHIACKHKLGLPKTSKDSFDLLKDKGLIQDKTCDELKNMVGFRNIAVHDYKRLDIEIVKHIIENKLPIFLSFLSELNKV